jgi:hypothetical protein
MQFPILHNKSKSSNFSLYCKIFLRILLPSTQVTKSSMPLVTKYAGSVIVCVPTLTWPCSIIFVAACTVSAILILVITTGSRRRAKAETVTAFSTADSFEVVGKIAMSCNFERSRFSCLLRMGSSAGRAASLWANWRRD